MLPPLKPHDAPGLRAFVREQRLSALIRRRFHVEVFAGDTTAGERRERARRLLTSHAADQANPTHTWAQAFAAVYGEELGAIGQIALIEEPA